MTKIMLVAMHAGQLTGYAAASTVVDEAELETIVVAAESRRAGTGSQLLSAIEAWAKQHGARMLLLEVRAGNERARLFYAARGFRCVGLRPGYYTSPPDDALLLRKNLLADEL